MIILEYSVMESNAFAFVMGMWLGFLSVFSLFVSLLSSVSPCTFPFAKPVSKASCFSCDPLRDTEKQAAVYSEMMCMCVYVRLL